ncbi:MAG: ATP-binding protein [Planctomycetota bacterium]
MPPSTSTTAAILDAALRTPTPALAWDVTQKLRAAAESAGRVVEMTAHWLFDPESYADVGRCTLQATDESGSLRELTWDAPGRVDRCISLGRFAVRDASPEVVEPGTDIELVRAEWPDPGCGSKHAWWIIGPTRDAIERFFLAVCKWTHEVHGEVLVFSNGHWHKDAELYDAIRSSTLDDLVLAGDLREQIREDFVRFLGARKTYEAYGVPWKRGVLFLGPPGNGKTHCVKAVAALLGIPVLVIRNFASQYTPAEAGMEQAFMRARASAPCLMVLEDLDSLITDQNRSYFLNEMDGFARNAGIITLATTNHPEKLDPAILDRPSRFDMKYTFALPGHGERLIYIARWNARLEPSLRLGEADCEHVAGLTASFSFAYLKELFLSSLMHWMRDQRSGGMRAAMEHVIPLLREQMRNPLPERPRSDARGE